MVGFNIDEVNATTSVIFSAYDDLYYALHTMIQNEFINEMKDKWACKEAVDFFNKQFKPDLESMIERINFTFRNVVQAIFDAADLWATETGWIFYPATFSTWDPIVDVGCIRDNISGLMGIDLESARNVAANLNRIKGNVRDALNRAKQGVRNAGFVGGSQRQNLINTINQITNRANISIDDLMNNTYNHINDTVQNYKDTAGKISQAFQVKNAK